VCVLLFIVSDKCIWATLFIVTMKKKIINVKKQKNSVYVRSQYYEIVADLSKTLFTSESKLIELDEIQ